MPRHKSGRLSEDIKRELAALFKELKDPRIVDNMVTITRVDVTDDGSYAKIYVSALAGGQSIEDAVKGFESASGFIKRDLSNRLHLRKSPDLKFIADHSAAHSARILDIMDKLK